MIILYVFFMKPLEKEDEKLFKKKCAKSGFSFDYKFPKFAFLHHYKYLVLIAF